MPTDLPKDVFYTRSYPYQPFANSGFETININNGNGSTPFILTPSVQGPGSGKTGGEPAFVALDFQCIGSDNGNYFEGNLQLLTLQFSNQGQPPFATYNANIWQSAWSRTQPFPNGFSNGNSVNSLAFPPPLFDESIFTPDGRNQFQSYPWPGWLFWYPQPGGTLSSPNDSNFKVCASLPFYFGFDSVKATFAGTIELSTANENCIYAASLACFSM